MQGYTQKITDETSRTNSGEQLFPAWLYRFNVQAVIIALLAMGLYCNTFHDEFALDDNMVILRNSYVLEGVSGIPGILGKDTYDSYFQRNHSDNVLTGGRYRPLSVISFAIEQQLLGAYAPDVADSLANVPPSFAMQSPYEQQLRHNLNVRHVWNVVWFALSMVLLLYFLRYVVFKNDVLTAFIATVIFTVHPIHTEVVANIKSRDEIFSLLFICLTFIFAFKYREHQKKWQLVVALVSYLLALLSKEYGLTLILLLPMAFYLFGKDTLKKSLFAGLPYLAVVFVYLVARFQAVPPVNETADMSISNNPFAYAVGAQKISTEIGISLNYLKLLVFPHPLSSDYSYNSIPYMDFTSPQVWLSIVVHFAIVYGFYYFFKRKNALAFAIAFYMLNLLLVNNLMFGIGATMGERLIYHSSVGFAIVVAYLLSAGVAKMGSDFAKILAYAGFLVPVVALCGYKTIDRNTNWKDNFALYTHDIAVVPNSFLMNANLASIYINKAGAERDSLMERSDLLQSVQYFNKAVSINDQFLQGYIYRGLAYFRLGANDSALSDLNKLRERNPGLPDLAQMYYNVGVAFYKKKQYESALHAWQLALEVKPDYAKVKQSIDILYHFNLLPKPLTDSVKQK